MSTPTPSKLLRDGLRTLHGITSSFVDPVRTARAAAAFPAYLMDLYRYVRMPSAETLSSWRIHPVLGQDGSHTSFDSHYVHMGAWAFRHIAGSGVSEHVDVGGQVAWITCLASVVPVVSIDIRPLRSTFWGLQSRKGSVLDMPYPDRSVSSLSCLHVAEHIGLGRYGDPLDPLGTQKAMAELARIIAPGGQFYFALPVGKPQVCFNAHRVHDPLAIQRFLENEGLTLTEFAAVDDKGDFRAGVDPADYRACSYGCGMYRLVRAPSTP